MITYEQYKAAGGTLGEIEFNQLVKGVCRLIDSFIHSLIPYWRIKPLSEYGIDFSEAIAMQIDFIADNGGRDALNGKSDFNIASASTKNFNYTIKNTPVMFNNIPLSPLLPSIIKDLLRYKGLMCMGLV